MLSAKENKINFSGVKIFITGAAGYVGGMLAELFLADERVARVVALDMKDTGDKFPKNDPKFARVTFNLGDDGWQEAVLKYGRPDVVIHCAYVIRQGFGRKREWQNKCNLTAADKGFDFVFASKIPRLIHFSTVASYGARPENTTDHWFKESDPFREEKYLYGVDKKIIEEKLRAAYSRAKAASFPGAFLPQVLVVRPCAISGPRGQFIFKRFGLLQMVKEGLPIIPITGPQAARQYIHEDDVADIIFLMAFGGVKGEYEIFNIAPPGFLLLKEMARAIGKKTIRIPMWLGKLGFAFLWYAFRGLVPTVPVAINSYTYPIIVDGSKITGFGYKYKFGCGEALAASQGRYALKAEELKRKSYKKD